MTDEEDARMLPRKRRGTGKRWPGGLVGTVVVASLLAVAVGCADERDGKGRAKEPQDRSVAPTELCGGKAVSAEAGEALKVITGTTRFEGWSDYPTVAHGAQELRKRLEFAVVGDGDVCRFFPLGDMPDSHFRVTWELVQGAPTGEPDPKFTELAMGERALTARDAAFLQFACRSEGIADSPSVLHVRIGVENWAFPKRFRADPKILENAHATVAHSFSLAMAKELGCENDGGLAARPSLDPA
ncbi:hypothetical protein [Streptomyces sp. NPDC057554]|uniref:hypothetical protein n=1 Tax=Streptomyces sp. NPDC057554 TaxID=3350538 RepID=UPI0036809C8F